MSRENLATRVHQKGPLVWVQTHPIFHVKFIAGLVGLIVHLLQLIIDFDAILIVALLSIVTILLHRANIDRC